MASVCRKMSLPARRCTPQSTSLRCSRTASSSDKCTVLPLHREDVTCNSAQSAPVLSFIVTGVTDLSPDVTHTPKHLAIDLKDLSKGR